MDGSGSAYEFLDQLRKQHAGRKPTFDDLMDYLDAKAREKGIPLNGQFELTPLCNFDCKMCYVHLTKEQMKARPLLMVEQWKEIARQAWEAGMLDVALTGGECLAYPGFREIYLYLHSLGCGVTVMTNAALLDEDWMSFFREHPPKKFAVTLYGSNEEVYERVTGHRAFAVVMRNIHLILAGNHALQLTVTPSRYLGEDVFDTIRLARETSKDVLINSVLFPPQEDTGRAGQDHDVDAEFYTRIYQFDNSLQGIEIHEIASDKLPPFGGPHHECRETGVSCGGGRSSFIATWQGYIVPCNALNMIRGYPLRNGFQQAWRTINQAVNAWPRTPECIECPYESVCDYCVARRLAYAEPGKQPQELCERTRRFVQRGVVSLPDC